MTWNIEFLEEAKKDLKKLDHSVQLQYHIITYQKDCHRRKITFFANVPVLFTVLYFAYTLFCCLYSFSRSCSCSLNDNSR